MITESEFHGEPRRVAQRALALLVVVNVMSQLDRQIMGVLVEEIRLDLGFSDTEIGIVVGIAFAVFYTLAGLPLGRLADRANRRNVIVAVLSFWSLATAACGLARGFWTLFLARVGVGIGEAGCAPAAQSILSDTFPPEWRGRALSTYQLAIPIGILIGVMGGGFLADHLHWRTVFFVVGLPGLAVAVVTRLLLKEPPRSPTEPVEEVGAVIRFLLSMSSMRQIMLAASIHTLTLASTATFNFAFMVRIHGLSNTEAGLVIGAITGIAGGFGTYLGGWAGDRLALRDPRWRIGVLGIGAVLSVPFSIAGYLAESLPISIAALTLGVIGGYMYTGACHAVSQSLARPRMRALTAAAILFVMNLFGYGGGPVVAGLFSDAFGGEDGLRYALAVMTGFLLWAAVHYALATRHYREDLARVHGGSPLSARASGRQQGDRAAPDS